MFMDKTELKNTIALSKIKLKVNKKRMIGFLFTAAALILANFIPSLITMFKVTDAVMPFVLQDFSIVFSIAAIFVIIILTSLYRQTNEYYSVFPQTNNSRFISSQIYFYIIFVCMTVVLLLIYLLQFGIFKVLSIFNTNIILAYKFNLGFIISGFFVLLTYGFIIISFVSLIGTLVRKFRIYTTIIAVIFVGILFANIKSIIQILPAKLAFLIGESNIFLFIAKGLIIWIVSVLVSILINKYTVYYKSSIKFSKQITAGICVAGVIIAVISSFVLPQQKITVRNTVTSIKSSEGLNDVRKIILDAASVLKGSKIDVVSNIANIDVNIMNLQYDVSVRNGFENFKGEKIIITYKYPIDKLNGYDLISYTYPKFTAVLDGNTLNVNFTYEKNVKVIFIPTWSFMWQFDQFKTKNIFKEDLGTSFTNSGGFAFIEIES